MGPYICMLVSPFRLLALLALLTPLPQAPRNLEALHPEGQSLLRSMLLGEILAPMDRHGPGMSNSCSAPSTVVYASILNLRLLFFFFFPFRRLSAFFL